VRSWVAEGIAVMLITSELDELFRLCDRILVLHRGRIAAELTGDSATKERVLGAAMGQGGATPGGRA